MGGSGRGGNGSKMSKAKRKAVIEFSVKRHWHGNIFQTTRKIREGTHLPQRQKKGKTEVVHHKGAWEYTLGGGIDDEKVEGEYTENSPRVSVKCTEFRAENLLRKKENRRDTGEIKPERPWVQSDTAKNCFEEWGPWGGR